MAYRILALIKDGNNLLGCRLYDETNERTKEFTLKLSLKYLDNKGCSNAKIENGKLIGTECDIDRISVINRNFETVKEGGIIVLNCIKSTDETVGYTLLNTKGEKLIVKKEKAISLARKYGVSNASLVENGVQPFLRGIKKSIPVVNDVVLKSCKNNFCLYTNVSKINSGL